MLKPDPSLRRQLAPEGPMLLWRTATDGRREALTLLTDACANAECPCRDVVVQGWLTGEDLVSVTSDDVTVKMIKKPGAAKGGGTVLTVAIDIDTGTLSRPEGAPSSERWAMEWLKQELDPDLLSVLRARFASAKVARPPFDWRKADWSWWKPGKPVTWFELHPDDDELAAEAGGSTYEFPEFYCVEPGCLCEEVTLYVSRAEPGDEFVEVGGISLNPSNPTGALFEAHGQARVELKQAWAALVGKQPIGALLTQRRDELRKHAVEIHRLFGAPAPSRQTANRNDPCPCGSGLKHKKCCLPA